MQAQAINSTGKRQAGTWVMDVTNWFIPTSLRHSRTHRGMAQIFVQSHVLAGLACLLMVGYMATVSSAIHFSLIVLCVAGATFAALPFLLRQTGKMQLATLVSFQTMTVASLVGIYDYGGWASPFLPWLLVSLMSGLFYQSKRTGLILGLFAVDVAVFLAVLLWQAPPQLVPAADLMRLSWVSIASAMAYMAFMALYYARIIASRVELELEAERYRAASLELEQARAVAERVSRNRSLFFSKMSHELRTPLNAVINYSEMLLEDCQDDPTANSQRMTDLSRINATGKHLLSLVSDVFHSDNMESEARAIDVHRFSLGELLDAVVATSQPLIEEKGNKLVIDCPLRGDLVATDDKKLRQMLLNLLSNAAKFTTAGTITLELWIERGVREDRLHAAVKDTGIGIAPEVLPQLFETYMQADATIYSRFGGTGIGLNLTRKFAVLLGGQITVVSRPNEGSTFTIDIPAELKLGITAQSRAA